MSARLTGRFVFLAMATLLVVAVLNPQAPRMDAAQVQGSRPTGPRVLRLPATPFPYETLDLPEHFKAPNAQRFDTTPPDNPVTNAGATLGRVLFYDTRLSANNTVSCGSCHVQKHAFVDPERFSRGFAGGRTDRHAMNLVNLRYHPRARFFWDERAGPLETMVLLPIENHLEMGQDLKALPGILAKEPKYGELFTAAFGEPEITTSKIGRALAQFIRSMVSYQSRYDVGRAGAMVNTEDFENYTLQENRGKALFLRNCALCHLPDQDAHFVMLEPVNTGLDDDTEHTDGGVADITLNPRQVGQFKSPSLRNVAVTGPYMHDGRFATLSSVIDHYSTGGKNHPNKDVRIQPLNLTNSEKAALLAFLETLTDPKFLSDPKFSDPFQ